MSASDTTLTTERLRLRRWRESDREAFHALNADPLVMATIGPVMTRAESDALMNRISEHFREHGYGLWCVDRNGEPVGFTGLSHPWFRDGVEIGWRLRSQHWGRGYATEAARAVLGHAFTTLGLDEVISFTAVTNTRSRAVMERIGLEYQPDADFEHPGVPEGNPLRPHVLFSMSADVWTERYGDAP